MPFKITRVDFHNVKDGNKYLLDSNIWIEILTSGNNSNSNRKKYSQLFQKITSNPKVKIVLPSIVVSEVINRILRDVYMKKYAKKNGFEDLNKLPSGYYKDCFRSTQDFKIAYSTLCDDIKIYHSSIELITDSFGDKIKFKHVLNNPIQSLDFNDQYLYYLAKKNSFIIVTDDKDFWVEDVEIISESRQLNENQKEWIVANKS